MVRAACKENVSTGLHTSERRKHILRDSVDKPYATCDRLEMSEVRLWEHHDEESEGTLTQILIILNDDQQQVSWVSRTSTLKPGSPIKISRNETRDQMEPRLQSWTVL